MAVQLEGVTKQFPLFESKRDRFWYHFPWPALFGKKGDIHVNHKIALKDISVDICRGEKVGIIGRNGSGKTTLLNLIIGYIQPTEGQVFSNGKVQALMQSGLGFHEDLSGEDNVRNALQLNGLNKQEQRKAYDDVIDFVELGEFIKYPFKTYSLGMRARLEFATATSIYPDVLAIDEVLGAGDGYFASKCAERMRNLINKTTLLLVTHSMAQIHDFCDRAIWIDNGIIMDDGPTESVVKAYEAFMTNEEAKLQASIKREDKNIFVESQMDLPSKTSAKTASERLLGDVSLGEEGSLPILTNVSFGKSGESHLLIETGEELEVKLRVDIPEKWEKRLRPVLYGFTENGTFTWEAYGDDIPVSEKGGQQVISVRCKKYIGGVGNFFLSIGLQIVESNKGMPVEKNCSIVHSDLYLRVLETNFSDPPVFHCPGDWYFGKDRNQKIESRICAWV